MNYRLFFTALALLVVTFSLVATPLEKGTEDLNLALLENDDPAEMFEVVIVMREQYDTNLLYNKVKDLDKQTRREFTVTTLKQFSELTQLEIRQVLTDMEKTGWVDRLNFLWISNVIALNATQEALLKLDKRDDIDRLLYDQRRYVLFETETYQEDTSSSTSSGSREITYNIEIMNIPDVWDQGYLGEGAVVAVLDTGVNYNHNDLVNQMWTHPEYPNHGYNFTNNSHNTMDYHGHGTHCAGTVAGDGTSGSQTGAAPQSLIMALAVLDSGGGGQESFVWSAIQFSVDHGADVMSISLGWTHNWNPDRTTWRNTMNNALSAGVIASVAAGNEGNAQGSYPIPTNLRTPGDCPPPWLHPDQTLIGGISAVVSVGATDSNDLIANFSSRGPVSWQNVTPFNDYAYNPGMGLLTPDIVAPGVSVKSLLHSNNSGYTFKSGTSMATPGVAGVMALMLSKNPSLLPEQISQILEETADSQSTTKNNIYGSGRIDALAALANVPPLMPTDPSPVEGAEEVILFPFLSWATESQTSNFFVSLGTDNPPSNVVDSVYTEETFFQVTDQLETSTIYYWRVDAINNNIFTEGEIWSFTTTSTPISENFESGDFTNYNWMFLNSGAGVESWFITSDESHSGTYSARSGEIGDNAFTSLFLNIHVAESGDLSFYRKVSTEQDHDYLRFFVNNSSVGEWSGESGWVLETFHLNAGSNVLHWFYMKDGSNSSGEDAVWIDNITFPPLAETTLAPENLAYEIGLEQIQLSWDNPPEGDDDPMLIGFNIYRSYGQGNPYHMINTGTVTSNQYNVPISVSGEHHYYVTAVYDIGESGPSESTSLTIGPAPAAPVIDPPAGEYEDMVTVSIETDDPEAFIFYTLDESEPTTHSILYTGVIEIEETTILKVRLFKEGHLPGSTIENEYEIYTSTDSDLTPLVTELKVYPNPLVVNDPNLRGNRNLRIDFQVKDLNDRVSIEIFNIKGQRVKTLRPELAGNHRHSIFWDLTNSSGREAGSGIYLIRMIAGQETLTKPIMIVK